jgi:uncharacterized protein YjbI with pentapeptide repeats
MKLFKKSVRILKGQTKIIVGITAGMLVGGVSTTAVLAAIPGTNNIIHACYQNTGITAGQVRIIDNSSESCGEDETAISWSSSTTPGNDFVDSLVGADLSNSDLRYRDISGHDLHGANFSGTNLTGTNLNNTNLSGTMFNYGVRITNGATFRNANFSNATFGQDLEMTGADFTNANFSGATADQNVAFTRSNFTDVDFRTTGFTVGSMPAITDSNLTNVNFSDMDLNGMFIQNNIAANADFSNVNFTGSWLAMTNLTDANLSGTTWSNTQCPDITNSDDNGGTCIGHLDPAAI